MCIQTSIQCAIRDKVQAQLLIRTIMQQTTTDTRLILKTTHFRCGCACLSWYWSQCNAMQTQTYLAHPCQKSPTMSVQRQDGNRNVWTMWTRWSLTVNYGQVCVCRKGQFLTTIYGLVVTSTLDLLTSKSKEFIFVPNCIQVISFVKFPQTVCKIWPCTNSPITECLL